MAEHLYASVRRRGELETDVAYWKKRAEENQTTAWNDGLFTGIVGSIAVAVALTGIGFIMYSVLT